MIKKIIGALIIFGGLIGAVLAGTADVTGLNVTQDNKDAMAFGWLQLTLVIVGAVILLFGIVFMVVIAMKKPAEEEEKEALTPGQPAGAGTVEPSEQVAAQQSQDLYGTQAQQSQDLYGTQTQAESKPAVRYPASYQQETSAAGQSAQQGAVDFSAGGAGAQQQDSSELLNDLDGLDGLEDLAEDLGGAGAEKFECPDCGAELQPNATKCSDCGAEFSEEIFECPICGAEVPAEAKECPKCGEEFAED